MTANKSRFASAKCDGPESDKDKDKIVKCQPGTELILPGASLSLPSLAYLELTPACNNCCPGCSNDGFIANYDTRGLHPGLHRPLRWSAWKVIIEKLAASVTRVILTGGEATLHPDFKTIVRWLNAQGIDFAIFTNGRWHEPIQLVSLLAESPYCRGLLVSLHGATAVTHDRFTGVMGSFGETVASIQLAIQAGLNVSTSTVITRSNLRELAEVAVLSRKLGAQQATYNRYLLAPPRLEQPTINGLLGEMVPSNSELQRAIKVIEEIQETGLHSINYGPCIPECFMPSSSQGCGAGDNFLVVDPWGRVKPCTDTTLYCGNLLYDSLAEVWQSEGMQSWRDLIPSGCVECTALAKCRAGCRAMALSSGLGHDPLMRQPIKVDSIQIRPPIPVYAHRSD